MKKKAIYDILINPMLVLVFMTTLAGFVLASSSVSADDSYVSTATIRVAESCSITSTLDIPHIALLPAGIYSGNYNSDGHDYRNGIGKTTIKAFCNDSAGFSIYAIGYTNDTFGNNTLIGPDNNTIVTGTGTSGETSNWAMKIGTVAGTYAPTLENGYGSFKAVPSTYDKIASFNSVTDLTNGSSITTTYAAYIASTQAPGTYNGKVKYTLVHPVDEAPLQPETTDPGKICYYANARTYEGTMGCQTVSTTATSATLLADNFSRSGYGFAGWSNKFDYATNPNQEGIKFYGPNEDITFTAGQYTGTNNGLSLYAIWVKSQGSLQDGSKVAELCGTGINALTTAPTNGTANLSSVSALTDQRDNNTYAIAKLADGKCWMIENLRLESTNSDNSTGNLAQGYGKSTTYGNFSGLADAESTGFTSTYTANSLYYSGTQEGTASIDIGTSNNPGYRMPRYNNINTFTRASSPTGNNNNMYSYGNYYTWHAAIADLTYNGTNNQSTTGTSLCPAGWHLPKGGNKSNEANNELWSLVVDGINGGTKPANYDSSTYPYYTGTPEGSDASNKLRAYPNNFLYSGLFTTSSAYSRGSNGLYWSSTANGNNSSYRLYLSSSGVHPGTNNNNKYYGLSIRCTASAGS